MHAAFPPYVFWSLLTLQAFNTFLAEELCCWKCCLQPVTLMILLMCDSFLCDVVCSGVCSASHIQSLFCFAFKTCYRFLFWGEKNENSYFPFHKPWHHFKFSSILRCIFYFFIGLVFKLYQSRKIWPFLMGKWVKLLFGIRHSAWSHQLVKKN